MTSKDKKILLELYNDMKTTFMRHIEFEEPDAYDFFSCWILGTYIFEEFESFPYIYLHGAKRCGKSKVLTLTSKFASNSIMTMNISEAAVYRLIEQMKPSLFIDEADYMNAIERDTMMKILQSGYKKGGMVYRCDGQDHKIKKWDVYCPKMIASVKELKEQFRDRCVTFYMIRSRMDEIINQPVLKDVSDTGIKWTIWTSYFSDFIPKHKEEILKVMGEINIDEIKGRDRELFAPILAVAFWLDPKLFDRLKAMALKKIVEHEEIEKESLDVAVLEAVLDVYEKDGWYKAKDIHHRVVSNSIWNNVYVGTTGKVLRRLGFQFKKTRDGAFYLLESKKLIEKCKRFGVVYDKQFTL